MMQHVRKVAKFFAMQLPVRLSRVTEDMRMKSDEQRRIRCRQIDRLVSKVFLRILPAYNRRRRDHSPLTLQSQVVPGSATGMLPNRVLHPIPLETTGHTPSHMDRIPATDLIDSAWSSILATMAMATRNRNRNYDRNRNCNPLKWRRLHLLRLVFRVAHK
jgi:hypothetical protein